MDICTILGLCSYPVTHQRAVKKDTKERLARIKRLQVEKPEFFFACLKQFFNFLSLIESKSKFKRVKEIPFIPEHIEGLDDCEISFVIWDLATILDRFRAVPYSDIGCIAKDFMGTRVAFYKK